MAIFKKWIGNTEYTFCAEDYSNKAGLVHSVELFAGDVKLSTARLTYQNRTWETYKFQTAMLRCVSDALERIEDGISGTVKRINGWDRLTASRRETIAEIINSVPDILFLRKLYKAVQTGDWRATA